MVPKDCGQDIEVGIRSTCSPTDVPTSSEHQNSIDTKRVKNSSNLNPDSASGPAVHAPERKLILFVVRLAVLEKAASGIGYLCFIWTTVVLLGGFAVTLERTDFWFVTIILFIEGARIFIRSQELELHQYQATWLIADLEKSWQKHFESRRIKMIDNEMQTRTETSGEMMPTQTWGTSDIPILPFSQWANKVFYWLQLASATACAVLSVMKLIKRNYGEVDTDTRNREAALNIFYSLALAEALFIFLQKAHWGWMVIFRKVLEEMNKECELGHSGMVPVTRFFYDAYSRCVKGSIVDGLKMDMVSFAMDLMASDSQHIQLIGIWVLREFAMNKRFSNNTLQKIRTSLVEGRLFQMLNWKALKQKKIRHYAAEIISELAKKEALQVSEIRGAVQSISSLLQDHSTLCSLADEIPEEIIDDKSYSLWTFNNLGLSILKNLARDRDNCRKIGNTRGLLPKIVDLTHAEERLLVDEKVGPFHIMTVTGSLEVLKMMASTTGTTGKQLRTEILELDSTISNIRDILNLNQKQMELQKLGIEILTSLAMDDAAAERIAGTSEVLQELVQMLNWKAREQKEIRQYAAEMLLKLTDQEQNALRVSEIPDAMESISSLLEGHSTPCGLTDESYPEEIIDNESDSLWTFNNLGLRILKNLVRVSDNCRKMGITIITNIGAILNLEYGEKQIELQKLGIGILTRLAKNEDAAERFGGEVLMELFKVFFKQGMPENWNDIRLAAGDALATLAVEFNNTSRMLSLGVTEALEIAREDPALRRNAEKIWIELEMHSIVFGVNIN